MLNFSGVRCIWCLNFPHRELWQTFLGIGIRCGKDLSLLLLVGVATFYWSLWLTRNDSVFHKYGLKYFYKSYSGHIASDFEVNCNEVKIRKNASTCRYRL